VFPTAIATRDPPRQTARGFAERSLPNQVTSRPSMAPRIDFIGDEALATAKTPGYSVYYSIQHNMIDNYLKAEPEDHYFLLIRFSAIVTTNGTPSDHVILCVEGCVIRSAIKSIPIVGRDISQFVLNLMRERGDMANVPPEDQLRVAGKEEENYSYACHDHSHLLTPLPEIVGNVIQSSPIGVRRGLYKARQKLFCLVFCPV
ncbi:Actin-related protein 3, partial [Termitomyces sp. J132]